MQSGADLIQGSGWHGKPAYMPKALSFDLRSRVMAAIDAGLSCRKAAARVGVSASSAIRWQGDAAGGRRCRAQVGLWTAIGSLLGTFTPVECTNYFQAAGYDAT
jgi:hypothetical protein